MPGHWEIILIVVVVIIIFGAGAIPKFAKSIGQAKSEFEKGIKEGKNKKVDDKKSEPENKEDSKDK